MPFFDHSPVTPPYGSLAVGNRQMIISCLLRSAHGRTHAEALT